MLQAFVNGTLRTAPAGPDWLSHNCTFVSGVIFDSGAFKKRTVIRVISHWFYMMRLW